MIQKSVGALMLFWTACILPASSIALAQSPQGVQSLQGRDGGGARLDSEVVLLRKAVVYLNDVALRLCRTSRDSLVALAVLHQAISEANAARADSLAIALKHNRLQNEVVSARNRALEGELRLMRIATGVLIIMLLIAAF